MEQGDFILSGKMIILRSRRSESFPFLRRGCRGGRALSLPSWEDRRGSIRNLRVLHAA